MQQGHRRQTAARQPVSSAVAGRPTAARGIEPLACFRQLLIDYEVDNLRGAYNWEARRAAGFSEFELAMLEDFAVTRRRLSAGA
ncbi:hypothetical protein D3C78_1545280 [compost metagenome]